MELDEFARPPIEATFDGMQLLTEEEEPAMSFHRDDDGVVQHLSLRRTAVWVGVVCAFAAASAAAQAATTAATGTLTAGGLSVTAPSITPFTAILTGVTQTVNTQVGAWSLTDAVGDGAAYNVTVSAGARVDRRDIDCRQPGQYLARLDSDHRHRRRE
jgi:hypothetical protein